jgi:hypothetical protein
MVFTLLIRWNARLREYTSATRVRLEFPTLSCCSVSVRPFELEYLFVFRPSRIYRVLSKNSFEDHVYPCGQVSRHGSNPGHWDIVAAGEGTDASVHGCFWSKV